LILRTKISNPVIILDEIDKTGGSKHNGTFAESLLPMIEPSTAKNFHDNCLQAKINLSGLNWLATSNNANLIPKPLRDRFQMIQFPSPGKTHIPLLADQILAAIFSEQSIDVRWYEKLSSSEIEVLSEAWPGGSLRALKQLIRGVLLARDDFAARH
jgi:ATP-dependent Lon protease